MAAELPSVRFAKINLESTPAAFAREQGVKALPTFHVFRAGARVGEMSGNNPTKRESQRGFLSLRACQYPTSRAAAARAPRRPQCAAWWRSTSCERRRLPTPPGRPNPETERAACAPLSPNLPQFCRLFSMIL
jgi:hypothetical protein